MLILTMGLAVSAQAQKEIHFSQEANYLSQLVAQNEEVSEILDQTISLDLKNKTIEEGLDEVARETGLRLVYSEEMLLGHKKLTLNLDNVTVRSAIWTLLEGTGLRYGLSPKGHLVIVKKGSQSAVQLQTGSIEGTVTDAETGEPLPGANILVEGTNRGVATNADGEFTLDLEVGTYTLIARFIGYEDLEKEVEVFENEEVTVNFALPPSESELEELVVTGYQSISGERMTGSFDVVETEQLERPTNNIATRLIGTTAGVQADLDVDGNPTFQIRGLSTLYGNESPLLIVDGYPVEGGFDSINPNDVKNVTILKDAAAASVWGARAANGVIVIETKSGERDSPLRVEVSSFYKIGGKFDLGYVRDLAGPEETVEYERLLFNRNWSPLNNTGSFSSNVGYSYSPASTALNEYQLGNISESEMNQRLEQLKSQSNAGQIKDQLLANPVNKQFNISISGGSENMSNYFSLLYENNQSNFQETFNDKYQIDYRTNAEIFQWLDFDLSAMLQYKEIHDNGVSLSTIQGISPYEMLMNENGSYNNISQYYWPIMEQTVPMGQFPYQDWTYNPIEEINNRDLKTTERNFRIQGGFTFKILEGLTFNSKIQYENFNSANRDLYNENTFYVRSRVNEATEWDRGAGTLTPHLPTGSILDESSANIEAYNFRNKINLNREFFEKHHINFVAGTEINDQVIQTQDRPPSFGYNDDRLTVGGFPNGTGNGQTLRDWQGDTQTFPYQNSYTYRTERYFSAFANLAYTFNQKYSLSGSYRTDASNLITDDPSYRYAPFWSAGVGWHMSEEQFIQDVSWIDRLNLRLTYGYNGNVDKSTSFRPLISYGSTSSFFYDDIIGDNYASIASYGNPTLRWEKTGTWNIGIDYSFFEGKLFGKVDLYNKKGTDLIAELSIPSVYGTDSQKLNNAAMLNRGIEVEVGTSTNLFNENIRWNGNLAFSYNHNEITNLFVARYQSYDLYGGGTSAYVEGESANSLWAYEYIGIIDGQPHVQGEDGAVYDFGGFAPGEATNYMQNMGPQVAPYTLGFTSNLHVHNFDISFVVTGKFGHVFKRQAFNYPPKWTSRILPNSSLGEVMNGDPDEIVPMPLNDPEPRFYFWDRFHQHMDYLAANASHVRMQEVNITYNLPPQILSKINLNGNLRVFVQGNDLFTILANEYGEDPEYPRGGMKPQPKFTVGTKLTF